MSAEADEEYTETVAVSRTTRERLRRMAADNGKRWMETAAARDDGLFDVPVSRAVKDALYRERRTPEESDEAVIVRLLRERAP